MAKIWHPHAKRETVGEFIREWCIVQEPRRSLQEAMFFAYECFCRNARQRDLTLGQFNAEMEARGFRRGMRSGMPVWEGIGLCLMEDAFIQHRYGIRYKNGK